MQNSKFNENFFLETFFCFFSIGARKMNYFVQHIVHETIGKPDTKYFFDTFVAFGRLLYLKLLDDFLLNMLKVWLSIIASKYVF